MFFSDLRFNPAHLGNLRMMHSPQKFSQTRPIGDQPAVGPILRMPVPDWARLLRCTESGAPDADFAVTGERG
jgi:hypothetical protein